MVTVGRPGGVPVLGRRGLVAVLAATLLAAPLFATVAACSSAHVTGNSAPVITQPARPTATVAKNPLGRELSAGAHPTQSLATEKHYWPADIAAAIGNKYSILKEINWWRRRESNPRPRKLAVKSLHAYPVRWLSAANIRAGKSAAA